MRLMAARARGTLPLTSARRSVLRIERATFDVHAMNTLRQYGTTMRYAPESSTTTDTLYVTFVDDMVPHEVLFSPWLLDISVA